MFGKLKELANSNVLETVIARVEPIATEHLGKALALGSDVVANDLTYMSHVIEPAYLALTAAVSGATKLVPQFRERFERTMLALRDELIVVEGNTIHLVDDFRTRLPGVLARGFNA